MITRELRPELPKDCSHQQPRQEIAQIACPCKVRYVKSFNRRAQNRDSSN